MSIPSTLMLNAQVGYTGDAESVEKKLITKLRSQLGIGAKVHLVDVNSITRSEGKAKRVIDNRKLHD